MSANLKKITPFAISLFIGISITFASFAYQKMGPEMGSYGNAGCEVQPNSCINGQMMGERLGAGFPLQYALDKPTISIMYSIGYEDDFKFLPFSIDVLFYTVIFYGSIKLTQNYKQHRKKQPTRVTA